MPALCVDGLPSDQDRLLAVGKLWVTVKYFHPYLAYRKDIDWDRALLDALPKIRAAQTAAEYGSSLKAMISPLQHTASSAPSRRWLHYTLDRSAFVAGGAAPADTLSLDMGSNVKLEIQLSEPVRPDAQLIPDPLPDSDYGGTPYPSTELRILSAYKLWGVMHYFFAYRDLMDDDWDQDFAAFMPKFIEAKDAREYHLAVAEAVAKLCDSNTEASSRVLDEYFGVASVGLKVRLIDKKPLVTEVLEEEANKAGVAVGDIITRVDDEEVVARINREAAFLPASTHQALSEFVVRRLLNGPEGSEAVLTVRHHDGSTGEIKLKRHAAHSTAPSPSRHLSAEIGYVDLTALPADQVDSVFEQFASKKTIIFDARGDIDVSAAAIASRLNDKPDVAGAILTGPLVLSPDLPTADTLTNTSSFFSVEAVPTSTKTIYGGKSVMLIDGRTIREAEHLGLLLEAANKAVFVGTVSAGAYSHLSKVVLPGGITVRFSSTDIRHGNSGKLQRVGLEPAVSVAPDLADIRAGRDVVLEKAIEYAARQ